MNDKKTQIQKILHPYPNVNFSLQTPIRFLSRISEKLGCNVYIKREDLTGFALGGNKVRKLDFLIGDAMKKKADTLVTKYATSFSRNASAACKIYNLDLHVFIMGAKEEQNLFSQAFFQQYEAELHYTSEQKEEILNESYDRCVQELKEQGKKVYELHPGGSDEIGTLGYIQVFDEIVRYSRKNGLQFSHIIHATGSSATQAGLLIGQNIAGYQTQMIGMAISQDSKIKYNNICGLAEKCADLLGVRCDPSSLTVDDQFIGDAYPIPTAEGEKAVKLFADLEGILLDPVYTGKAAAGMMQYAANGQFKDNDNILFVHTGGNAGIYY